MYLLRKLVLTRDDFTSLAILWECISANCIVSTYTFYFSFNRQAAVVGFDILQAVAQRRRRYFDLQVNEVRLNLQLNHGEFCLSRHCDHSHALATEFVNTNSSFFDLSRIFGTFRTVSVLEQFRRKTEVVLRKSLRKILCDGKRRERKAKADTMRQRNDAWNPRYS